jgi:hypothetical protein
MPHLAKGVGQRKENIMSKKLIFVSGNVADAGQFDDSGEAHYHVQGGEHDSHEVTIYTEKHNCGAYGESVNCSCGEAWQSSMHGCWQAGHQREEFGNPSLEEMMRLAYERVGEPVEAA